MINYSISIMSATPGTRKQDITSTKAYALAQTSENMSIRDFALHISEHGCVYSRADVQAILIMAVDCLREQMLAGKKVSLGDLGSFYPSLKSEGAETADKFTAQNIKAVNVRWEVGSSFKNLRKEATFKLVPSRKKQAEVLAGDKNTDNDDVQNGGALPGLD